MGVQKLLLNGRIAEDFFDNVEFDYGIDYDGGSSNDTSDSDNVAEVISPMLDLSPPILEQVTSLNPLADSTVMAVVTSMLQYLRFYLILINSLI